MTQIKSLQKWSFWFAVLLHFLIFLFFSYVWIHHTRPEANKEEYIRSYAYQESLQKAVSHHEPQKNQPPTEFQKKEMPTSKNGIEKPIFDPREVHFNEAVDISPKKSLEPVHLIGDTSKTPQPLIIILGKAITAKLRYPKSAIDLNIGGISVIGFMLYPDGQVSDVRLLKSSRADVLDEAALFAASHISPVSNVGPYVKEPMPIVFGIVFGSVR